MRTFKNKRSNSSSTPAIQPALEIGESDDKYEKEANAVADKVMKMQDDKEEKMQMKSDEEEGKVQMKSEESDAIPKLQTKTDGQKNEVTASESVEQGIMSTKGNGQSLPKDIQQEMGNKMGADFSGVNIHTDHNAVQMNKEVGAKAFTHGNDIYFNKDQFNPANTTGKHLLAHELTHTIQQTGSKIQPVLQRATPFTETKSNKDNRSFYINGATRFNKIKQMLMKADVIFEGSPTPDNIVKKTPPGGSPTEFYVGTVSTTTATKPSVTTLLDAIVATGGEVFVTKDEFITKMQTLLDAFRSEQPNTFSNLQVQSVIDQKAIMVNNDESCIETMNKCIQNIYGTQTLKKEELSDTAFGSIDILKKKGMVTDTRNVSLDYIGTGRFQIRPDNIDKVTKFSPMSFSETMVDITKDKEDGLYITVCSLLNGYHSIIVMIKKEKGVCRFLWKDQHDAMELTAEALDDELKGYASGRYSWRIRERYAKEYHEDVPTDYDSIKNEKRTKDIEDLEKPNIIDDLKKTIVAPLLPK